MTVGDPREKNTRVGPLITPEHFKRVEGFVDRALKSGVKPLWGGKRSAPANSTSSPPCSKARGRIWKSFSAKYSAPC